ncbi:MAG: LppX_LprAFG lipoprotein [Candidatus Dormibacteria bacterium]
MPYKLNLRVGPLLALMALIVACGSAAADPNQLLKDSAQAMSKVSTAQANVTFGPGATIQGFELQSATGTVKRPSDSQTLGKVKSNFGTIQPELISVGGQTYLRQTQFLPWQKLTPDEAAAYPNAGRLLDADHGVTAVLPKGTGAALAGSESVDGHDCNKVTATFTPAALNDALAPVKITDAVKVTLWLDKADKYVRRVRITGHVFDPAAESFVDVRIHDFNAAVTITAPG